MAVTLTRRSPSGELRYLEMRGRPVFDAGGQFQGYRGIGREVTDQPAWAELERTEERIHALIACSTDGYWEQDADLRYTAISASSGHLADLGAEDSHRHPALGTAGRIPDEGAVGRAHRPSSSRSSPSRTSSFCRRDRAGRVVWLSESGIPVFDRNGVFAGYCGTTRNITAEVRPATSCRKTKPSSAPSSPAHRPASGASPPTTAGSR